MPTRGSLRRGRRHRRREVQVWRFIVPLISLVLTVYIAETFLHLLFIVPEPLARHYFLGVRQCGARLQVRQTEYTSELRYNRYGFRESDGAAFTQPTPETILFLGDSFVEGFGVSEQERFSNLVAAQLRQATSQPWRSINAGQLATQPIDYFHNLVDFGLALRPRLVVMTVFVGNDFINAAGCTPTPDDRVSDVLPAPPASTLWNVLRLGYLSALGSAVTTGRGGIMRTVRNDDFWAAYFRRPVDEDLILDLAHVTAEEYQRYTAAMKPEIVQASLGGRLNPSFLTEALIQHHALEQATSQPSSMYTPNDVTSVVEVLSTARDLAAERQIGFLVVILPDIYQVYPAETEQFLMKDLDLPVLFPRIAAVAQLHRDLTDALAAESVPTLDCTAALRAADARTFYIYDQHLTAAGHQVVSRELVARLQASDLLAPPTTQATRPTAP